MNGNAKPWRTSENFNFFDLARHVISNDYIGQVISLSARRLRLNAIAICTRITRLDEHTIQIYRWVVERCAYCGVIILESNFISYVFQLISEAPQLQELHFILRLILYKEQLRIVIKNDRENNKSRPENFQLFPLTKKDGQTLWGRINLGK